MRKKQKEAGIITEEQYKELEAAAKAHKEEQKGTADDTYYGVLNSVKKNLGETSKYINIETGEIEKELAGMGSGYRQESQGRRGENIKTGASEKWEEIKMCFRFGGNNIKEWWNTEWAPKFTKKYWKDKFNSILDSAKEVLADLKKRFEGWRAKIKTPHMYWDNKDGFNTSGLIKKALEALNLPTVIPKLKVRWLATGGILDRAQFIGAGEAGAEAIVPLERNLGG